MPPKDRKVDRAVEARIEAQLRNVGWIDDLTNTKRNVWRQTPKTEAQLKSLKGTHPDYILYKSNSDTPLAIIAVKRLGGDLHKALQQGADYADAIKAPVVFATDGVFVKTLSMIENVPLLYNGKEVKKLLPESVLRKYTQTSAYHVIEQEVGVNKADLIKRLKRADAILRAAHLDRGIPRLTIFANFLFLKMTTESMPNALGICWKEDIQPLRGAELQAYIDELYGRLKTMYGDIFLEDMLLQNAEHYEGLVDALSGINMAAIAYDVKGEAFEYFLHTYSKQTKTDLGQYFTPRHIISLMVRLLDPQIGEQIYDPFCGTGGMLIEAFKYLKGHIYKGDEAALRRLKRATLWGRDASQVVRTTKMNMILFGEGHANIALGDSLAQTNEFGKYDVVITNIPFAQKAHHGALYDVPTDDGDSICVQHALKSLKDSVHARAGIIVPISFLCSRDKKAVRSYILDNYALDKVIDLPNGVFLPYTNTHTAMLIIRNKRYKRSTFEYYDVENDGFSSNNYRMPLEKNGLDKVEDLRPDKVLHVAELGEWCAFKTIAFTYKKGYTPLGELCTIKTGKGLSPNKDPKPFVQGTAPFVMVRDIAEKGVHYALRDTRHKLNAAGIARYNAPPLPAKTILVPSNGVAILKNHRALTDCPVYLTATLFGIVAREIDPFYVFFCLLHFDMRRVLYDLGYPGLKSKDVAKIPIYTGDSRYIQEATERIKEQYALQVEQAANEVALRALHQAQATK